MEASSRTIDASRWRPPSAISRSQIAGKCGRAAVSAATVRMNRRICTSGAPPRRTALAHAGGERAEEVGEDGAVEGGLVLEVVVEHRLVHAGARGDAIDLGPVESPGGELRRRGGEQAVARRVPAGTVD